MPASTLAAVCERLEQRYGNPRHGNKRNPLDELMFIVLSTRTRDPSFRYAYRHLKQAFPRWSQLTPDRKDELAKVLQPYGLSELKADQIVRILERLRVRFRSPTLAPLRHMTSRDAEAFLTDLPGVAQKIAKCVLMYSLDRSVLPVDVHVHRLAARLGLHVKKRPDTSQDLIESQVPAALRYGLHVNAIAHGRSVCLPRRPRCRECCVREFCKYYRTTGNDQT